MPPEEHGPEQDDAADGLRRREFLQVLAGSFAALSVSGCRLRPPKEKVVPRLVAVEEAVAGKSLWYATTCGACPAACGALAKVRDGRPIKLEGNPEHPLSRGGLCARGQASVLDLYDSERFRGPVVGGKAASWDEADLEVMRAIRRNGGLVRLLTGTEHGPTALAAVSAFNGKIPRSVHLSYDAVSSHAILEAHRLTHGRRVVPGFHLEKAKAIASFDADFLGTWLSPVELTRDWAFNRRPEGEFDLMSWHAQFEARMSVTGANADLRVPLRPSQEFAALAVLGRRVAQKTGWTGPLPRAEAAGLPASQLAETADMLVAAGKRAVVLSGSRAVGTQVLVNWVNHMLGAYEGPLDLARPSNQRRGDDAALGALIAELEAGKVGVLIVRGVDPAFDHPRAEEFRAAIKKAGLVVSLASRRDELSALAGVVAPDHHALEAWADHEPRAGIVGLSQPSLAPLFDTRHWLESLGRWSGDKRSAYELVRDQWRRKHFPRQRKHKAFEPFWEASLQSGALTLENGSGERPAFSSSAVTAAVAPAKPDGAFELVVHPSSTLEGGAQANNPWLQELPDPITKVTWGNCASFAPADAQRLGLVDGRLVRLKAGGRSAELPAHLQPGQAPGTVAASLGWGKPSAGAIAANFPTVKLLPIDEEPVGGADLFPLLAAAAVEVEVLPGMSRVAKTQEYDFAVDPLLGERRPMVREASLEDFARDPRAGNPKEHEGPSLWTEHEYPGAKWGMAIDLNSCTGCSGCVVACTAENNVPVVGKAEVAKSRDMHWLRLDRYYSGAPGAVPESPEVSFQPMLCQHCGNAPCETVCPVLATVHSTEGLNMQVYNRCVGTRYCANNCPYKVRRFNWFDYAHQDLVQNLALNPDVTVRTRGIMEKCSFCVQRIYEAKADAKEGGRPLADGDIKPACAQSCPAQAIVFGDLNDPKSRVSRLAAGPRAYRVLPELGVGPSVYYLTKVRNRKV